MSHYIESGQQKQDRYLTDNLFETVRAMPKIELHRHLEGSIRLETLVDIAREHGIEMPEYEVETVRPFVQMMPEEPHTMRNFMAKFAFLRQFFLSPEIIRRITREAILDAAADNIKYLELRFTPRALSNIVNCSLDSAVAWVCEATAEAAAECGIQVQLIVSMNRHEGVEIGQETLKAALAHLDKGVVGLDLAGIEEGYSAVVFRDVFWQAHQAGLGVTLHAGEWEGPQSIWEAVDSVGADRIGHGIRAMEDPDIVSTLAERGIALEVCPTSNVDTGVVPDLSSHPLPRLSAHGVHVTINTDDPLVSAITLTDELCRAVEHMSFSLDDIKGFTLAAAQSAFLPEVERQTLIRQFTNWLYPQDGASPA
jgi:adenosine deaminase